MNQIVNLTDDATQQLSLVLQDGSTLFFTLTYIDQQFGWFINSLTYGTGINTFELDGFRVVNSPNMFYQYQNQIPFGLLCQTVGEREPTQIQDFLSGQSELFILTAAEVAEYTSQLSGE